MILYVFTVIPFAFLIPVSMGRIGVIAIMLNYRPRSMKSCFLLRGLLMGVLPRVLRTRFIVLSNSLRLLRVGLRSFRRRLSSSRVLRYLFGVVFVLFSLLMSLPAYAGEFDSNGVKYIPYTPSSAPFLQVSNGSVSFYPDYVWLKASGTTPVSVSEFSTPIGLVKKGDILAISVYPWDSTPDTFPYLSSRGYLYHSDAGAGRPIALTEAFYSRLRWEALGKDPYTRLLAVRDNTAYFSCERDDYCWTSTLFQYKQQINTVNGGTASFHGLVMTSYLIRSGQSPSDVVASEEKKKADALASQDNSGKAQQKQLENSAFQSKSSSLSSSLKQIVNAPARSCSVSGTAHTGLVLDFDFCSTPRPPWLGPLLSLPVAITSLFLSIHVVKLIASEIEKFRAGV